MRSFFSALLTTGILLGLSSTAFGATRQEKNPYGIVLTNTRFRMVDTAQGRIAVYLLKAAHLPSKGEFLLKEECLGDETPIRVFTINDDGILVRRDKQGDKDIAFEKEVWVQLNLLPGQVQRYILVTRDGTTDISTSFVPYPIEAIAKDGARVSLEMQTQDARTYKLVLEGFLPNEALTLREKFGDEFNELAIKANSSGAFDMDITPKTSQKTGGNATLELIRKDKGSLVLNYDWGDEALKVEHLIGHGFEP